MKEYLKTFNCPSCGGQVEIRAPGFSLNVVCRSCHAVIDSSNENYKVVARAVSQLKYTQTIPFGARGKLQGKIWEMVGFIVREDQDEYRWKEYLLFNPYYGYRWLSEYGGHWNFIKMIKKKPEEVIHDNVLLDRKRYEIFSKSAATVKFVEGEFYWQVRLGDQVQMREYISPPEILAVEIDNEEMVWSIGIKIDEEEIKKAFHLENIPHVEGIAPNQINPFYETSESLVKWCSLFFFFICGIQMWYVAHAKSQVVHTEEIHYPYPNRTASFEIPSSVGNLEIAYHTQLNNSWLEVQGELIDEKKEDESFPFFKPIEFYSGSDFDGYWSEGDRNGEVTLSSIPQGLYHINFDSIDTDTSYNNLANTENTKVEVVVTRNVPFWSNFFISVILILILPGYYYYRSKNFEDHRWGMSNV